MRLHFRPRVFPILLLLLLLGRCTETRMDKGLQGRGAGDALNTRTCGHPFCGAAKHSGLTLPKDKAVSRRQTTQYGKARPTQQRRILVKEAAVSHPGDALNTRVAAGVFC